MNTSTQLPLNGASNGVQRSTHADSTIEEMTQLKRQLLQAEVRLAKARAGVSGAEADVKVLNSRLRALAR